MSNDTALIRSLDQAAVFGNLSQKWGWLLALGLIQLILGIIGLGMTFGLTLVTILVYGIFLLIGGGAQIVQIFVARGWKGIVMHLLIAVLYVLAGIIIIANPLAASLILTLFIGFVLLTTGVLRSIMAFRFKRFKNWFWPLLSGMVSILLGLMIINQWPVSGLWVIGLFVAVELMVNGWSSIMIALVARKAQGIPEVTIEKTSITNEETMCFTIEGLKDMIYELHPEIVQHALNLSVIFDEAKKAYVLKFSRGGRELNTYLDKQDADECMEGKKCIHLGVQIAQFLDDFEEIASNRKPTR
jgi:uncharacterized membrane protein HdeD (DUF308 family)